MIVQKLNNLITKSNEITQKEDTDITTAMSSLIQGYGVGKDLSTPADLFNHGDVVGINPYYKPYMITEQDGTSKKVNGNGIYTEVTNDYIEFRRMSQNNVAFMKPMVLSKYSKLCFDCEVTNTSSQDWTLMYFYFGNTIRATDFTNNFTYNMGFDSRVNIITEPIYGKQGNIWGTTPFYKHERSVTKLDLSMWNFDKDKPSFFCIKVCDIDAKFYGIWFE